MVPQRGTIQELQHEEGKKVEVGNGTESYKILNPFVPHFWNLQPTGEVRPEESWLATSGSSDARPHQCCTTAWPPCRGWSFPMVGGPGRLSLAPASMPPGRVTEMPECPGLPLPLLRFQFA